MTRQKVSPQFVVDRSCAHPDRDRGRLQRRDFLGNSKYRYRPLTQPDVADRWPCEAENATSKRRPVQPPLPFYRKDAQPVNLKGQVNNVLPPRRLIAPSFLTTEIVARSERSLSKKLFLHEKLPKPPKRA